MIQTVQKEWLNDFCPFVKRISKKKRGQFMKPGKKMLALIFIAIAALIGIAAFGMGSSVKGIFDMRYGIDIRGGVEAIFEPQGLG